MVEKENAENGSKKNVRGGGKQQQQSIVDKSTIRKQGPLSAVMSSSTDGFTIIYEPI